MLDLRQFAVLDAVERTGSLAGAARELHFGQPTVSHHLRALERHLGVTLVERRRTGAVLTEAGRAFLLHARTAMAQVKAAEREVADWRDHGMVTLRIGTFASAGARLLPRALAALGAGSRVRVELFEGEIWELEGRLAGGELHCALLYDLGTDPGISGAEAANLREVVLEHEPFQVLLGQDHPAAGAGPVDLADLAADGWIRARNLLEAGERALMAGCGAAGFEPRTLLHSDDYGLIHAFVEAGVGVALVVPSAVDHRARVAMVPAAQDLGMRRVRFVSRLSPRPPVIDELERLLVAHSGGGV
ncbi:LysR family transcriptional regulator [Sediminivirga luteola]|uniref:LysR family transcriptional regulator n=1 Tax=Sediminivirga luteola TaxID=1774748 RepID=UPI001F58594A|nr:LysR family transcriptional regulator [Sediminivirga luteola]MCI2265252.1 LysR family transcriptional regulator [Sediminivirga luteola]